MRNKFQKRGGFGLLQIIMTVAIIAVLSALALPALADTGNSSFGITNASFSGSAAFTTMGQSLVDVKNQDTCDLVFTGTVKSTNASPTIALVLARVDAQGHVETSPQITWTAALPTGGTPSAPITNSVVLYTNLPPSVIGSATSLKLISATTVNPGDGYITTPKLTTELKRVR